MSRIATLKYATRGRVKKRTKGQSDPMKVLENMDVTTRAYRAHFDFPYSQVMGRVTRRVKEKTASFPHWW